MSLYLRHALLFLVLFSTISLLAQKQEQLSFWQPAEEFNKKRFWLATGVGTTLYTASMIGLNELWYKDFPRSKFHFFDDRGEWEDMDKAGHTFSAYMESRLFFQGVRWTGMDRDKAVWVAFAGGTFIQASIELLDGYSEKWGFSVADIGFNTLGCGVFAAQELIWQEQRFTMKVSSFRRPYPMAPIYSADGSNSTSIQARADQLFGTSPAAVFLKDYNAQTLWLSGNIHSFINKKNSKFPKWLNVAVGYGIQNVYGGFENSWIYEGQSYQLSEIEYPRYRQFYLSLDVDLSKIKTKNAFLRTVFNVLNIIKIPSPTLELNTLGRSKFHPFFF